MPWCCVFASPKRWPGSNDLRILHITRAEECTSLTWISHPGEFYTVYWTDALEGNSFWRVAAVNVPSGGTNTTWSECGGQGMGL